MAINQLEGIIPDFVGNFRRLLQFFLSSDALIGTIPSFLVSMTLLRAWFWVAIDYPEPFPQSRRIDRAELYSGVFFKNGVATVDG